MRSPYPQEKRLGILSALPEELEALSSKLQNKKEVVSQNEKFLVGVLGHWPVVLSLSGMGKVNAAITAQKLISEYSVQALLFTGVGGGISANLNIGDVVIAREIYQHDFGYLGLNMRWHTPGVLPEIGIGVEKEAKPFKPQWPKIGGKEFMEALMGLLEISNFRGLTVDGKSYVPKLHFGKVATGDQFIANEEKKAELAKQGADVVEMEGGAVAQVAVRNKIPFLVLRAISDKAGANALFDFRAFIKVVAENNALLIEGLLSNEAFASSFSKS